MLDDDVWRYAPLGPVPTLIVAVVGLGLLVYVARVQSSRSRLIAYCLLAGSAVVILALTARGSLGNPDGSFSWQVGESALAELRSVNRELGLINVIGNVLMFLPIGWLCAVLVPRRRIFLGLLAATGLSIAVEIWQMLAGSVGDIDDVVLNGVGGLWGAAVAVGFRAVGSRTARRATTDASPGAGA